MTALDWFIEELNKQGLEIGSGIKMSYPIPNNIFYQAKAMEKEQITDSYIMGSYDMAAKEFRPEQYYNEIYKTQSHDNS